MAETTASGYIQHHLQNLTFGQLPNGGWGFAHTAAEAKEMGFWAFHVDTLGWSVALGLIFVLLSAWRQRKRLRVSRVPCRTSLKYWSNSSMAA